jgi:hypothetical protein
MFHSDVLNLIVVHSFLPGRCDSGVLTLIAVRDFNGTDFSNVNGQVVSQPHNKGTCGLSIPKCNIVYLFRTGLSQGIQGIAPARGAINHW